MPSAIWPPVSLSRRTSDQPAGAVSVVPAPPRTVTWAIITSLATTPAGTGMVTRLLAPEVLPVAILRKTIGWPPVGVGDAVGVGVGDAVGVGVGDAVGTGVGDAVGVGVGDAVGVGVGDAVGVGVGDAVGVGVGDAVGVGVGEAVGVGVGDAVGVGVGEAVGVGVGVADPGAGWSAT